MKKLIFLLLPTVMLLLTGCASTNTQLQQPLPSNARVGVVAFMPAPFFISTSPIVNTLGEVFESQHKYPTIQHSIKGYDMSRLTTQAVANQLKQSGSYQIVPLYYNYKSDPDSFVQSAIRSKHLAYVIEIEPGVYSKAIGNSYVTAPGYGILYTYHFGFVINSYPVARAYADVIVTVMNHQQQTLASDSVTADKELRESKWKDKFSQLNPKDIAGFKNWFSQEVIPAVANKAVQMVNVAH